jgi:DNA-binding MarR family transcriptional regulator
MQPMNAKDVNQQCSCFNLRKAARAITQSFDHALEPMGIRATQFTLLVTMASVSARTLTEMANVLVMDRTTLTRNLKPLEKMGLIETVTPRDKRSKAYALTEKGRETLSRSIPVWERAQHQVVNNMGEERFNGLLSDLNAVTKAVSKSDK